MLFLHACPVGDAMLFTAGQRVKKVPPPLQAATSAAAALLPGDGATADDGAPRFAVGKTKIYFKARETERGGLCFFVLVSAPNGRCHTEPPANL